MLAIELKKGALKTGNWCSSCFYSELHFEYSKGRGDYHSGYFRTVKKVITKGGDDAMKRVITWLALLALLTTPILSACESSKLKEENEGLRKQIESLTSEKAQLQSQVKESMSKGSGLTAKVDELTRVNDELKAKVDELSKVNEELKAKVEKKAPTKMKSSPKNK